MKVESISEIVMALNNAKVRYLIVGGLAVVAHDYVRYTADLDLVVALEHSNISGALNVLGYLGYRPRVPVNPMDFADPAKRETWIREKGMVVFQMVSERHQRTPIDLFVTEPFDFTAEWERAIWKPVMGSEKAPVLHIDQLIAMKRAAGRPKDLLDVDFLEKISTLKRDE